MTDIEAAAEVATGAVVARAVEPRHGADDGHTHESACLNCGTTLTGPYCASCGQRAHVHRTLSALWHDIAHGVFHFEGKVWRTLPLLAWRPGEVTRRYIHGERARFVSPLALFLFSVFLMFAVFETVGGPLRAGDTTTKVQTGDPVVAQREIATNLIEAREKLARLEAARRDAAAKGDPVASIEAEIANARQDVSVLNAANNLTGVTRGDLKNGLNINTGSKAFDERFRAALADPTLLLYKLQTSAYKFAWALIPISLPFMWAMFAWRREYHIYDHAVFVTYSLSAVVLLLVIMALVAAIGGPSALLGLVVPLHFYRQLKQAYLLSTMSALWRTTTLLAATSIVLVIFGLLLLALGLTE